MNGALCGRLLCASEASSALLFAPQDCEAWIVPVDHAAAPDGVYLCDVHADRISVPFGWTLTDDRGAARPKRRRRKPKAEPKSSPETDSRANTESPASARPSEPASPDESVAAGDAKRTPAPGETAEAAPPAPTSSPQPRRRKPSATSTERPVDEPTIQLPAIDLSDAAAAPEAPAEVAPAPVTPAPTGVDPTRPSDVPVHADAVAQAVVDADDPRHLQVVAGAQAANGDSHEQPQLFNPDHDELEASDQTPLLRRAFRVVRDD